MGRPAGSPNRMTAEKDAAQKSLIKKYGLSPLESILQKRKRWEDAYDEQMSRSSRHRNVHKIKEAEEWILRYNEAALPYTAPKYQAIAVQSEVRQVQTVIRAPESIPDSKKWLEEYKPKHIDTTPVMQRFGNVQRQSLDTAEALGIHDTDLILKEAKRQGGN